MFGKFVPVVAGQHDQGRPATAHLRGCQLREDGGQKGVEAAELFFGCLPLEQHFGLGDLEVVPQRVAVLPFEMVFTGDLPRDLTPQQIAQAQAKVDDIYQRLEQGLDFASAAISYSESQEALEGGLLGWRDLNTVPAFFADAVREIEVGQFTRPVRSPLTWVPPWGVGMRLT